jgi:hypothetical protein
MNYYRITTLYDLTNEIWVDCYGLEGEYKVSNYGRIKSVERQITTKSDQQRLIPEMIRKQIEVYRGKGKGRHINSLTVNINRTTYTMSKLVYQSFNKDVVFKDNEVVMHLNKVPTDNRIVNLKKVDRKVSKRVDMILSTPTKEALKASIEKLKGNRERTLKKRTTKTCSVCGVTDNINEFMVGRRMHPNCYKTVSKTWGKKKKETIK